MSHFLVRSSCCWHSLACFGQEKFYTRNVVFLFSPSKAIIFVKFFKAFFVHSSRVPSGRTNYFSAWSSDIVSVFSNFSDSKISHFEWTSRVIIGVFIGFIHFFRTR